MTELSPEALWVYLLRPSEANAIAPKGPCIGMAKERGL
jgi:hypothetical protein